MEWREGGEDDLFLCFSDLFLDSRSAGIDAKEAAGSQLIMSLFLPIEP